MRFPQPMHECRALRVKKSQHRPLFASLIGTSSSLFLFPYLSLRLRNGPNRVFPPLRRRLKENFSCHAKPSRFSLFLRTIFKSSSVACKGILLSAFLRLCFDFVVSGLMRFASCVGSPASCVQKNDSVELIIAFFLP